MGPKPIHLCQHAAALTGVSPGKMPLEVHTASLVLASSSVLGRSASAAYVKSPQRLLSYDNQLSCPHSTKRLGGFNNTEEMCFSLS